MDRSYQQDMAKFVFDHPRCALHAGMGSGKSKATLDAFFEIASPFDRMLVLAPKRVCKEVWPEETAKWTRFSCLDLSNSVNVRRINDGRYSLPEITACNYEKIPWLIEKFGSRWPWSTVVCDESTRLKSFRLRQGGKRAGTLKEMAWSSVVKRWINLTGTPAPNGLIDLWGQYWFLDRGERLGHSFTAFVDRWFYRRGLYQRVPHSFAEKQILDRIADITYTLDMSKFMDIDKPMVIDIPIKLPDPAMRIYRSMAGELYSELQGTSVLAPSAVVALGKCMQIANGFLYDEDRKNIFRIHEEKLNALESLKNEAGGMPLLVFYQFVADRDVLLDRFPEAIEIKQADLKKWNRGEYPMMLAHPASAGHGLNLQRGSNIAVFYSRSFNLEHYLQAVERIGPLRQKQAGLNRPVYVYRIVATGTVDGLINANIESKELLQEKMMDHLAGLQL